MLLMISVILFCSCKEDYATGHNKYAHTSGEFTSNLEQKENIAYEKEGAMKTVMLRIIGKVQGVWFRASAKDKALSLGLKGKVWNEKNGDVGIIVQGPQEKVSLFIEWCKEGPRLADVQEVIVEEVANGNLYNDFDITRGKD